jgi:endonuclease YncB( thermonuclease family)
VTLSTKADIEEAKRSAQVAACHNLRVMAQSNGVDWGLLAKAMFHAGEAWAYYQSSDVIHRYAEKAEKPRKNSVSAGEKP